MRAPVRAFVATALVVVLVLACHSVTIRVERSSSGAIEGGHGFIPSVGSDGHYIIMPAANLVDCMDMLEPRDVVGKKALVGSARPCASSQDWRDLVERLGTGNSEIRLGRLGMTPLTPGKPEAIASFIHLSDAQIREPNAKLGGEAVSRRLDPLIQSFEHDFDQELYSGAVYDAIIDTINAEVCKPVHGQERNDRCPAIKEVDAGVDAAAGVDGGMADAGVEVQHRDPSRRDRVVPSLVIHTGDAMDAGLQSEFEDFKAISNRLFIPWYQVIGNHDLLAFGNLRMIENQDPGGEGWSVKKPLPNRCEGKDWSNIACTCTPVSDLVGEYTIRRPDNRGCESEATPKKPFTAIPLVLERICLVHRISADRFMMDPYPGEAYRSDGLLRDNPKPRQAIAAFAQSHDESPELTSAYAPLSSKTNGCDVDPSKAKEADNAYSRYHGFDLDPDCRGYYRLDIPSSRADGTPAPRIVGLVLNTSTEYGAYGEISNDQFRWMEDQLKNLKPDELLFVFSHHPIFGIRDHSQRRRLLDLLGNTDQMVAYFAGHTHGAELRIVHPPTGHRFWEAIAPSTMAWPQQARQITVHTAGDLGYIDVLSFSPIGTGESAEQVELGRAGAARDRCVESAYACDQGRPRPPPREITFPRLYFRLPAAGRAAGAPSQLATDGSDCPEVGWQPPSWVKTTNNLPPLPRP